MENVLVTLEERMRGADPAMPLHKRLRDAIQGAIVDNVLKAGSTLPSERTLAETLSLSRVTVRKAIESLVEEGLVHRRHGARTEVGSRVEKSPRCEPWIQLPSCSICRVCWLRLL